MAGRRFSLAVVKGASAGTCIRSARKRISVGSAIDNDLILTDPGMAPRHYLVVIDSGWRVHALSEEHKIKVQENWQHPDGGTGAIVTAGSTEVLIYPGDLSQQVIDEECHLRGDGGGAEMATAIDLPRAAVDRARGLTKPVVPVNVNEIEMASMDTVAARPPGDLRSKAQELLNARRQGARAPPRGRTRPSAPPRPRFHPLAV